MFRLLTRTGPLWAWLLVASVPARAVSPFPDSTRRLSPYALTLSVGSTGAGLQVSRALPTKARLVARAGVSYFAFRKPFALTVGDSSKIDVAPDLVIGVVNASLKWHPFRRGSFFLTGGAGYTWHPTVGGVLTARNKLNFGGILMSPDNFGTIQTTLRWNRLLGYAGLGFGHSVPRRRVGVGVELGVYYLGAPRVAVQYEGFLETTTLQEQVPTIERNLSAYRWLPNLQFNFTYAFRQKP